MRRGRAETIAVIASLLITALAVGCGDNGGDAPEGLVSSDSCSSGLVWEGGSQGSALMHPGGDCMGCHSSNDDAPSFAIAGTVYLDEQADDDCAGVEGAIVVVEDDEGQVLELPTNRAGNFFARDADVDLSMPLQVKVRYEGNEKVMQEPLYSGNCYNCHSGQDAVRAPARVLAPAP
ncbi:hypothetical protein [Persicimonas caeni]|uniref:hypothetical protein n=1 Tax=Persicimonas caeni TaxID=2292766 RepID=UPI00143D20AB|nr:hypothetical protein [Persicimonas caeni]